MFRITTAIAAMLLFCATAQADSFGAIAFSPDTGASSHSTGRSSRGNAQEWALYYCGEYADDCRIAINFRNACGAVARGSNGGWGSNWGYNRAGAENNAISACRQHDRGCRVVRWACSK